MVLDLIYDAGMIGFVAAIILVSISLTYIPRFFFALLRFPFDRQSISRLNTKVFTTFGRYIRSILPVMIIGLGLLLGVIAFFVGMFNINVDSAPILLQLPIGAVALSFFALVVLYIPIVALTYIIDYLRGSGNSSVFSFISATLMFVALPHFVAVFEPPAYDYGLKPLAEEYLSVDLPDSKSRLIKDVQQTFCNKQIQGGSLVDAQDGADQDFTYLYTVYLYDHAMRAILFDLMETYRCSLTNIVHSDRDMYFSTVLAVFKIFISALFTSLFISPLLKNSRRQVAEGSGA